MSERFAEFLQIRKYTPPGIEARGYLLPFMKQRSFALTNIESQNRRCAWCNVGSLPTPRHKYCGQNCAHSAYMFTYPQCNESKMWRLIHQQNCRCAICGRDYEGELFHLIKKKYDYMNTPHTWDLYRKTRQARKINYFYLGQQTGFLWQLDHKVALCNGGDGLGMDNHQVVCVKCHDQKTVEDRRQARQSKKV